MQGCPWDLKQTFSSIASYTLEEAFEVADAIERNDMVSLKDELGDLLLQVVFHSQMAKDQGLFDFHDVAQGIADKMVHRHPHVFSDQTFTDIEAQKKDWENRKRIERKNKREGTLDGIPVSMPGLSRSKKLQKRAASVGFDWPDVKGVEAKLREELQELDQARESGAQDAIAEEFGDVLFTLVNLARRLKIDPEAALRGANHKFEARFRQMEAELDRPMEELSLEQLDAAWNRAKGR